MLITVLNGSPKALTSVTMQYVLFLQKKYPQHEFRILNVCHDIKRLEDDLEAFREVVRAVEQSAIVLWATPVYVLLVPGPYKRFVELVFERSAQSAFKGKYAASLTTSVRFFDHTALGYLHAVCDDLGMNYVGGYSAEMYDLVEPTEQQRLLFFWETVQNAAEQRRPMQRRYAPVKSESLAYVPAEGQRRLEPRGRKIVVVSDAGDEDANLQGMVRRFCGCFADPPQGINLCDIRIRGGCQGCIHCSFDNVCVYRNVDDVHDVYQKMVAADVVIHAVAIKDRFLAARWKTLLDRGFFNNHVPVLAGKQLGYLVSGPLGQLPEVRQILEAFSQIGQMNLVGIVSDECGTSQQLDRLVDDLARQAVECVEARYIHPMTFLGKAGKKVLRDEVWAGLRFVFPRDHEYYKRHGMYDFPRRSLKTKITEAFVGLLLRLPSFRKEFQAKMKESMIEPLAKVVEQA